MAGDENLTASLCFLLADGEAAFSGVGPRRLVLALLATTPAEAAWTGCRIFVDHAPGEGDTVWVRVVGPAAAAVQQHLAAAFHRTGIPVQPAANHTPPQTPEALAEARDGRWI